MNTEQLAAIERLKTEYRLCVENKCEVAWVCTTDLELICSALGIELKEHGHERTQRTGEADCD